MVSPKASIKNSVKGRRLPSTFCLIQICIEYTKDKNVYWGKASILSTEICSLTKANTECFDWGRLCLGLAYGLNTC